MIFANKGIIALTLVTGVTMSVAVAQDIDPFPPCSLEISCPCTPDEIKPILEPGDKILFKLSGTATVSNSIEIK